MPLRSPVTVYGTSWCAQIMLVRRYRERLGMRNQYVDLETEPEANAQLRW
ncbi:MAG TPA: hypothetical protein VF171_06820 [Trueperaceae bacterium]